MSRSVRWAGAVWIVCFAGAAVAAATEERSATTAQKPDADKSDKYDRILQIHGISATPEGILKYIRPLSGAQLRRLVKQLGDADYATRERALRKLSSLPVVPATELQRAIASGDPEVRYRAEIALRLSRQGQQTDVLLAALMKIRGRAYARTVPVLLDLIPQLQHSELIAAASTALRNAAQPSHRPLLVRALREGREMSLRLAALQTLVAVLGKDVVTEVRDLLDDDQESMRLAAAQALLQLGQHEGLTTLADLLRSDDVNIRAAAVATLRQATGKQFGFLAIDKSPARQRAAEAWMMWVKQNGANAPLNRLEDSYWKNGFLQALEGQIRLRLPGHTSTVYCIAFSPDGKWMASVSGDRQLKLWETAEGRLLWSRQAHNSTVRSVLFFPDGRTLATGSYDATIKLWDAKSGTVQRTFQGHSGAIRLIAVSPDGKWLASGSDDRTVRLWDIARGTTRFVLRGHTSTVRGVAFSPDGRLLASCGSDKTIRLWDVSTGKLLRQMLGHGSSVRSVQFSPDSLTLASASLDNSVRLWDVRSGSERVTLNGHRLSVKCVAFSADGRFLASTGNDKTVRLWNPATGKLIGTLAGPTSSLWHVAISPDGKQVAACGSDRHITIWNLQYRYSVSAKDSP